MQFEWPELLWLLALLPALAVGYVAAVRRRRRGAAAYPGLAAAMTARTGGRLRRLLPPALLLLALAALVLAFARPNAVVTVPAPHDVVVLAIDISGSMRASDVEPDRISAARAAAREFVERQPAGTRIGSGLLVALKAIEPSLQFDLRAADPRADPRNWPKPLAPGSNRSAAIVLLTDGESSAGPRPEVAAQIVAERGVRVYTVGLGTSTGTVLKMDGWSMRVRLDEAPLRKIADLTLGEYFPAASAPQLERVYRALDLRLAFERQRMEVTALFAAVAALLVGLSSGLSLYWFNRAF